MPRLKLFVSHSSRLDDIDHSHADEDHNWRLLGETCAAIRNHYGDRVDVLVDKDGLIPGNDWEHHLNTWLAECHVAVDELPAYPFQQATSRWHLEKDWGYSALRL